MTATQNVLASLDLLEANRADCEIVTRVCQAVSRRAAYLSASGKHFAPFYQPFKKEARPGSNRLV